MGCFAALSWIELSISSWLIQSADYWSQFQERAEVISQMWSYFQLDLLFSPRPYTKVRSRSMFARYGYKYKKPI